MKKLTLILTLLSFGVFAQIQNFNIPVKLKVVEEAGNNDSMLLTLGADGLIGKINKKTISSTIQDLIDDEGNYLYLTLPSSVIEDDGGALLIRGDVALRAESINSAIRINDRDLYVRDGRVEAKGIEYDEDYSSNYTDRSLVDKGYVDSSLVEIKPTTEGNFIVGNGTTTPIKRAIIPRDLGINTNNGKDYVPLARDGNFITPLKVTKTGESESLVYTTSYGSIRTSSGVNNSDAVNLGQINSLIEAYLKGLPSYNSDESQILSHDQSGNIIWVKP